MYLALYRKYRPKTFEDVISQPHITKTLKNEIQNGRIAHSYLFTGPRGTGKTTCAKILAMAVNCEHPKNGDPCFECASCKAIEGNATLDIVEIDAASNSGVDNIRDLRDEANYTPGTCSYRVYIIDEAHMLSTGAFNALLKIMEEPPEHVKFILATTEAHKVPTTILSRCQRFDFRRIRVDDIKARLLYIASLEGFFLDECAADLIARLADGGMRDALSLLDRCAGFTSEITLDSAIQTIGLVDRNYLFDLTDCIIEKNASKAIEQIDRLYSMSKDMQVLLEELLNHFRNLMLLKTLKNPSDLVMVLPDEMEKLKRYSKRLTLPVLLYTMGELQDCIDKMGRNFDRRMTLELCLVKICTPSMDTHSDALAARISRIEAMIENGAAPSEAVSCKRSQTEQSQTEQLQTEQTQIEQSHIEQSQIEQSQIEQSQTEQSQTEQTQIEQSQTEQSQIEQSQTEEAYAVKNKALKQKVSVSEFAPMEKWGEILEALCKTDMPLYGILKNSRAFTKDGYLYIDSMLSITGKMMKQQNNASRLISAVENKTGIRYRIRVRSAEVKPQSDKKLSVLLENARKHGIEVKED